MKSLTKVFIVVVILALAGLAGWYFLLRGGQQHVTFKTEEVRRTSVVAAISATGTIEPEEVVDVGAQVAGQILAFGNDPNGRTIDYGSVVEANAVLAKIDDSVYAAALASARATMHMDQAGLKLAQANLDQSKVKLVDAQRDWERAQKLGPSDALSATAYDSYRCAYDTATTNVTSAEASVEQAQAAIEQARAALDTAEKNLGYCTIFSPVKGVIIDRRVNIGQTVVASLNAPSLFLLAKDLTKMQVWVAVNEADIGSVWPGQKVTFTVDALPDRKFPGTVRKIRLNATMTQNVVTYTVEIVADNSDGKLLPYLTATALFEEGRRDDVLAVPNASLRYTPGSEEVEPESRQLLAELDDRGAAEAAGMPATAQSASQSASQPAAAADCPQGVLWVQRGQALHPVKVKTGLTDGWVTQVEGPELAEGMRVIVGEQHVASGGASNPLSIGGRNR